MAQDCTHNRADAAMRVATYLHQQEGPSKALPLDLHMNENKQQGQQAGLWVGIVLRSIHQQ
jgi:hypothetical protein